MSNSASKDSNSSPSALPLQSPPPSMFSPVVFSPPPTSSKPSPTPANNGTTNAPPQRASPLPPPPSSKVPPTPPNNGTINPPPQRASPLPPPPLLNSSSGLPEANFTPVAPLATSQSNLTSHGVGFNQQMKNSHAHSGSGSPVKESSKTVNTSRATPNEGEMFRVTLGGVMIIALIAFIFSVLKKRKKEDSILVEPIKTKQSSFSVKSGVSVTEHYIQPLPMSTTIHSGSYRAQPTSPMTATGYGSYRGYGSHSGKTESSPMVNSKVWFTYEELMDITDGFSPQSIIGEGGFGCVYKGLLPDGREVAVKELKLGSGQGEGEYRAEVEIISRVRHRHLVSLVGYCIADQDRLLVYEFVPNSTLEHHLHGKGMLVMEWSKRVKIAIGAAKGLAYLHEDCRIIHRDIKSANILLDSTFEAKVADFGLPKLSNDVHTHISTRVMGTFGYLAPEYVSSGSLTDRSDVFSFGVVLLELITGLRPVDASVPSGDGSLVDWARPLLVCALDTGDVGELLDPRLGNFYEENEVFRMIEIAAACVRHSAPKRPRMVQVVRALDSEGDAFDLCNGVKFVQSTNYGSSKSSADLQRFRQMGFDGDDYGNSREYERRNSSRSVEYHYRDSPNRSVNSRRGRDYRTDSGASVEFDEMKGAKYNWEYGRESPYQQKTPVTGHGYISDSSSREQYQPKNYPYGEEYHTRTSPLGPMNPRMVLSLSQNPSTLMREPRSGSGGNYRTHGDVYVNYASNHYYKKGINML